MWDGKMLSALVICLFQMKTQTKKEKKNYKINKNY